MQHLRSAMKSERVPKCVSKN